ncbi:hypothetical protein CCC_02513 [Paramagnetospirillum magnetotacticum MS-1]|uniref:Uncharacterized protein n=1 Tax=Paramagnetospirillum magnetotacticum MS-1 TaxID=272627 RepID=A0A0C2YVB3_PARME|nr:hypothetical protein CCC_02513 [Paramagnetospirillum magnetotacticum MS-1]
MVRSRLATSPAGESVRQTIQLPPANCETRRGSSPAGLFLSIAR